MAFRCDFIPPYFRITHLTIVAIIRHDQKYSIFVEKAYPINVLRAVRDVPEVCTIFCATANPVEVVIAESDQGRGILGVIDGFVTKGVEKEEDKRARTEFLRKIGYKLS